jgi:membrane protein YdbS with pleckstrin-like domain
VADPTPTRQDEVAAGGTKGSERQMAPYDIASAFDDKGRWLRPSARLGTMRRAEAALCAAPLLLAAGAGVGAATGTSGAGGAAAAVLVAWFLIDSFLRRRVASWGYLEREDDLIVRRGVAFRRLTVVPYGRMQLVDVTAGPMERIFGLATVRLHTAAAATDARVPGLEAGEARRLRDRLADLGQTQAQGL